MPGFGIYIHVPFCRGQKCSYCDFYSICTPDPEIVENYLEALEKELAGSVECFPGTWQVESIYFGGGTPSLLEQGQVCRLLSRIAGQWRVAGNTEITLECNPEDLSLNRANGYLSAGVNRLSVGCQSFGGRQLTALGRRHSASECRDALENARSAGFERLSADLLFGGPASDVESLVQSIETALGLGVVHLSLYGYYLEKICTAYGRPEMAPAGEESFRAQYLAACSILGDLGWKHYEIANWAVSEERFCRHNLAYWNRGAYLGCGPAAHSFRPCDQRFWNPADLDEYIVKGEEARSFELLEAGEVLCEELILGLRLAGGVGPEPIGEIKGRQFGETLRMLEQEGLGGFTDRGGFALTEHGWLVYDSVLECLIEESGVMLDKAVLNCHYH